MRHLDEMLWPDSSLSSVLGAALSNYGYVYYIIICLTCMFALARYLFSMPSPEVLQVETSAAKLCHMYPGCMA